MVWKCLGNGFIGLEEIILSIKVNKIGIINIFLLFVSILLLRMISFVVLMEFIIIIYIYVII